MGAPNGSFEYAPWDGRAYTTGAMELYGRRIQFFVNTKPRSKWEILIGERVKK
jgi:hypothetical protein